jgi:hypothetical protein
MAKPLAKAEFGLRGASIDAIDVSAPRGGDRPRQQASARALTLHGFAHGLADDLGQASGQIVDLFLEARDRMRRVPQIDGVELLLEAIEAAEDRRQIVAVAAGLFQNMAGDEFFALDSRSTMATRVSSWENSPAVTSEIIATRFPEYPEGLIAQAGPRTSGRISAMLWWKRGGGGWQNDVRFAFGLVKRDNFSRTARSPAQVPPI